MGLFAFRRAREKEAAKKVASFLPKKRKRKSKTKNGNNDNSNGRVSISK